MESCLGRCRATAKESGSAHFAYWQHDVEGLTVLKGLPVLAMGNYHVDFCSQRNG